ncbi:MAG: NFACT RNA binding domain-containing protein [Campylobacteraceae bacterium]|jgi:predicted ribosome quality control (RQC) complex YloA/Tae2 family protein|nr:NFACT RNA binding domain-containing protein [Campylobacteraceae bacterium]
MKYYELLKCAEFLQNFKHINSIIRVEDSTLKIDFQGLAIYASLKKRESSLFMCHRFISAKRYRAPFDTILAKRFTNAAVESLSVSPNDRVLTIKVRQKNSYKMTASTLLLEFTGKNTNAIILNESETVAEALRHIDESVSYRAVKVGEKLAPLPPFNIKEQPTDIYDIKVFLYDSYEKRLDRELESFKAVKSTILQKKIEKFQSLLDGLGSEDELLKKVMQESKKANLLMMHRHSLRDYAGECELKDTDGKSYKITISDKVQEKIDELFNISKKLKQKAKSLHKERENLTEKLEFTKHLLNALIETKSKEEAAILMPKRSAANKKEGNEEGFSVFFAEGYKVMAGKNERGNEQLLKSAKKNDIWFHIKDIPSSHVILKTDKTAVLPNVLEFCAKLCVNFSVFGAGVYEVDYTQRRNVKIISGANVTYTNFKTISILKSYDNLLGKTQAQV